MGELTIETGLSVGTVFGSGVLFCTPFSPDGVDGSDASDAAEQLEPALGFLVGENEFKTLRVMLVFFGDGVAASISDPPEVGLEVGSEACICGFFRAKLSDRAAFAHDDRGVAISATHRRRRAREWTARQFFVSKAKFTCGFLEREARFVDARGVGTLIVSRTPFPPNSPSIPYG